MSFVQVCDVRMDPVHQVTNPAQTYSFPLDPFQKHAISAMDQQHNVLVCAKTGSGKTLVAEYAIAHALRNGKRVFYTTPIKSLSNQKFHDLSQLWSAPGQVGIMTGDIKYCPQAPIVIMTTEILRNLLFKQGTSTEHMGLTASLSLQDLGAVVFDECHYINDRDRGAVWEETMILLPRDVQLVMLSATLARPELFAEWIGLLKQIPCHVISTEYRVVPLTHTVWTGTEGSELLTIMDAKERFADTAYNGWLQGVKQSQKAHEQYQQKVKDARRAGHEGSVDGKTRPKTFQHNLLACLDWLRDQQKLPALCFSFSRKGCESLAAKTTQTFLDTSDQAAASNIFHFHLRHRKAELETIPQYHTLHELIRRGIAFHHSGLLPLLKEVIELLFSKGYIKLLYCTETFAVGINMPTKTVIFTGLEKRDDTGFRTLRTDEYIQMAGRAGRRGKDTEGLVIYLPEREPLPLYDMISVLKGGRPSFESRMTFHYDFVLKTLQSKHTEWLDLLHKSYWYRQYEQSIAEDRRALETLEAESLAKRPPQDVLDAYKEKAALEETLRGRTNAKAKAAKLQLQRWNEDHRGATWERQEAQYKTWSEIQTNLERHRRFLQDAERYTEDVQRILRVLESLGYLANGELTQKGVCATEFNEGHPILCSELLSSSVIHSCNAEELCMVLALFMDEGNDDALYSLQDVELLPRAASCLQELQKIVKKCVQIEKEEGVLAPAGFWEIGGRWVEPLVAWIRGGHAGAICVQYGLFEGNFVRAVLRLSNLVEEWISVATFGGHLELLRTLEELRPLLMRDVVVPDSLYLHL